MDVERSTPWPPPLFPLFCGRHWALPSCKTTLRIARMLCPANCWVTRWRAHVRRNSHRSDGVHMKRCLQRFGKCVALPSPDASFAAPCHTHQAASPQRCVLDGECAYDDVGREANNGVQHIEILHWIKPVDQLVTGARGHRDMCGVVHVRGGRQGKLP